MNTTEMIKDLFINFFGSGETSQKEFLLREEINENTKKLNQIINKKHKNKLKTLCDDYDEINIIIEERGFTRGFSFAVQLMAEAFSQR